jgi:DNA-binding Lrp family transcriptional regulator
MPGAVATALREIVEVIADDGLSGEDDLLVHVVAKDAGDMYRVAGNILGIEGVERTRTSLVMRELIDFRLIQLLSPPR